MDGAAVHVGVAADAPPWRVTWADRSPVPRRVHRVDRATEDLVLVVRDELKHSDLGEYGAVAIRQALEARGEPRIPAVRTIGRILARRGALDGWRRVRRPPPPRGWYLPAVAAQQAELDALDIVEGLHLPTGVEIES